MKKLYNTHEERLIARRNRRRNNLGILYSDYKEKFILKHKDGCWEWLGCKWRTGYGYIRKAGKHIAAHRYMYTLYNGPIPKGLCILHMCDNPSCVNPEHLFLGTQQDNMRDMVAKGRNANFKGELNPNYKHGRDVNNG